MNGGGVHHLLSELWCCQGTAVSAVDGRAFVQLISSISSSGDDLMVFVVRRLWERVSFRARCRKQPAFLAFVVAGPPQLNMSDLNMSCSERDEHKFLVPRRYCDRQIRQISFPSGFTIFQQASKPSKHKAAAACTHTSNMAIAGRSASTHTSSSAAGSSREPAAQAMAAT